MVWFWLVGGFREVGAVEVVGVVEVVEEVGVVGVTNLETLTCHIFYPSRLQSGHYNCPGCMYVCLSVCTSGKLFSQFN